MADPALGELKAEELAAMIREVRERVRARYRNGAGGAALPDLMPVLHARDAAEGKVAAIGAVNPRPPGLVNSLVQRAKGLIARALDWHVRDQVEFNRAVVAALDAILEALNENNQVLHASREAQDVRTQELIELRGAFQHRSARMEANIRELVKALAQARKQTGAATPGSLGFAERFRGSEEYVREKQRFYLPHFQGCRNVLDIGCGRGEFLELMREAGVPARGIDLSEDPVAQCRNKGLDAQAADLFAYLGALPDESLDGIFSAQVVEHLPPERVPEMVRLAAAKLARGGRIAIETPNPECLAIFATHFYLDPTHRHPVPASLLAYSLEESGFGQVQVRRLAPAVETMPSLGSLPPDFREAFFGSLDYAILARKS